MMVWTSTVQPPLSAYQLRLNDTELRHLRIAISAELKNRKHTFPLAYWHSRILQILETRHLLPTQFALASALLDQLREPMKQKEILQRRRAG
jgi:hypothetical protein